jgi:hypothetical protein
MTKRLFYLTLGAAVGVLVMRRVTAVAESLAPDHIARRVVLSTQGFVREVRVGMAEREVQLRSSLGFDEPPTPA